MNVSDLRKDAPFALSASKGSARTEGDGDGESFASLLSTPAGDAAPPPGPTAAHEQGRSGKRPAERAKPPAARATAHKDATQAGSAEHERERQLGAGSSADAPALQDWLTALMHLQSPPPAPAASSGPAGSTAEPSQASGLTLPASSSVLPGRAHAAGAAADNTDLAVPGGTDAAAAAASAAGQCSPAAAERAHRTDALAQRAEAKALGDAAERTVEPSATNVTEIATTPAGLTAVERSASSRSPAQDATAPPPLAPNATNHLTPAQDMPPAAVTLAMPLEDPRFAHALGVQVSVLARDGVHEAELHLNPAEMGPVSVQIVLEGTQARVEFGADMARTRELIEHSLPELAAALRDAGFTLSGGSVSQQQAGRGEQPPAGNTKPGRERTGGAEATHGEPAATVARRWVRSGGVDLYA